MTNERYIDLLKFDINPIYLHETPYLFCTFEIKNETQKALNIFPWNCRLDVFDQFISSSPCSYHDPLSKVSSEFPTTEEGGGVRFADYHCLQPERVTRLYCGFELSSIKLNSVTRKLESMKSTEGAIDYRVSLELSFRGLNALSVIETEVVKTGWVNAHEWLEWLKKWNACVE